MKVAKIKRATLVSIILMSLFLLAGGCGSKDAKNEGCPSGTVTANFTDILIDPADTKWISTSPNGNPFGGGTIYISPLTFIVQDQQGNPRNNVCIRFFTGGTVNNGIWYSDNTYTTVVAGTGQLNSVIGVTNDVGKVVMYWSTGILPAAQPVTGTTAGKDQTGTNWVQAISGNLTTLYNLEWTVQGEQAL